MVDILSKEDISCIRETKSFPEKYVLNEWYNKQFPLVKHTHQEIVDLPEIVFNNLKKDVAEESFFIKPMPKFEYYTCPLYTDTTGDWYSIANNNTPGELKWRQKFAHEEGKPKEFSGTWLPNKFLKPFTNSFLQTIPGFVQAKYYMMKPGMIIHNHLDSPYYSYLTFHVPFTFTDDVNYYIFGKKFKMFSPKMYWINTGLPHMVIKNKNPGNRVNLIIIAKTVKPYLEQLADTRNNIIDWYSKGLKTWI